MKTVLQLHKEAQQAVTQRAWHQAHALCVKIIGLIPKHADAYFLLGVVNSEVGQLQKAIKLLEKAVSYEPRTEYSVHLVKFYSLSGDLKNVNKWVKQAPLEKVQQANLLEIIGVALSRVGEHNAALAYLGKAIDIKDTEPAFLYNYALSCKFAGKLELAREKLQKAINLNPDYYQAHYALSDVNDKTQAHNHIEQLETLIKQPLKPNAHLHLAHGLAKEYETLGQFEKAFTLLEHAKLQKHQHIDYHFNQDAPLFKHAQPEQFSQLAMSEGHHSKAPIFVVGMPKSGTTLVERIISSHSAVKACGELQDFGIAVKELTATPSTKVLDAATLQAAKTIDFKQLGQLYLDKITAIVADKAKFVDKLPFNFFYIGLIQRTFPHAKIICVLRDPMDTCMSNYRQLFPVTNTNYNYTYDLMNIAEYYTAFYQLTQNWQQAQVNNFLLLDYQKLVNEPEPQIRQLINFCDLDWQDACLYPEKNPAPISSASRVQITKPINVRSVHSWQKYQAHSIHLIKYLTQQGVLRSEPLKK